MRRQEWESNIGGNLYKFDIKMKNTFEYHLTVNNSEPIILKNKVDIKTLFKTILVGFEGNFTYNGVNMRLVVPSANIKKADVVIYNKFSKTGMDYKNSPLPKWVYFFIVACLALLLYSRGGVIPGAMAFGGIFGCIKVAKMDKSTSVKVIMCTGITALVWITYILLIYIFLELISRAN